MTTSEDVNDEGRAVPITLDLTEESAYYVMTQALSDFASEARDRADLMASYDAPDAHGSVEALNLANLADELREQIETQIDALSAPQDKPE